MLRNNILAIVPLDFALGFNLTGIDTQRCIRDEEAKEYLEKELVSCQYDLILIDEIFFTSFDSHLMKRVQESTLPLIMGIPLKRSFKEEIKVKEYFLKMVQDAIGYEIRVR